VSIADPPLAKEQRAGVLTRDVKMRMRVGWWRLPLTKKTMFVSSDSA
jgi:hypothetical protein